MGLKNPFAIKTVFDATDLELKADSGESFLIKNILIDNPSSNYITCRTEKTTVGYFRVGGDLGSHLPFPKQNTKHSIGFDAIADTTPPTQFNDIVDAGGNQLDMAFAAVTDLAAQAVTPRMSYPQQINPNPPTILEFLMKMDLFTGYPVASGETFKITGASQSGSIQAVIYEVYDEDDQKPDTENGSKATEYFFINYGRPSAAINTTTDTVYDTVQSPSEFPAFPYGKVVPSKTELDIIGLLASDICIAGDAVSKYTYSKYIKMVKDREVMHDEDRNGIPHVGLFAPDVASLVAIGEGKSLFGNHSTIDTQPPFMFPTPLTFTEGDELNIYLSTILVSTGGSISAARAEIASIMKARRTS